MKQVNVGSGSYPEKNGGILKLIVFTRNTRLSKVGTQFIIKISSVKRILTKEKEGILNGGHLFCDK